MIIDESCGRKVKNDTGQIMSGNCDGVGKDTHVFFQQIPWGLTIKYWSSDGYVFTIVWQKEMFFMGYNRQCGSLWWWWLTFLYNEIALRLSEKGQMCIPVSSLTDVCFLSRTGLLVLDMTRKTLFWHGHFF